MPSLRDKMKGSSFVELAIGLPIFIVLLFAIMSFAYMEYERSTIDWACSHIVDKMPSDYTAMKSDAEATIKTAILSDTLLSSDRLKVSGADIQVSSFQSGRNVNDALAKKLGSELSLSRTYSLSVTADVTYTLKPLVPFILGKDHTLTFAYKHHIEKLVSLQRRYEIS